MLTDKHAPRPRHARNVYNDIIRCEAPLPNLNFANIFYAQFGAKPPNLMTANISGYTVISPVTGGILRIHEHITVCGVGVDKPRILVLLFIFQLWSPLRKVDNLYHIWKPFTSSFQVKRYLYTYQQNFSAF